MMRIQVLIWFLLAATAHAQHTPQSVLAQTCLHEASVPVASEDEYGSPFWARTSDHSLEWGADCWLIHEVLLMGAARYGRDHGVESTSLDDPRFRRLYVAFARVHSEGVFEPVASDTNRWARDIAPPFTEPASWARYASRCTDGVCTLERVSLAWSRARPGIQHAWQLAGEITRHGLDTVDRWSVCRDPVDTWGGRMDHDHAVEQGFVEVVCDPAANTGWAYPSRIAERYRLRGADSLGTLSIYGRSHQAGGSAPAPSGAGREELRAAPRRDRGGPRAAGWRGHPAPRGSARAHARGRVRGAPRPGGSRVGHYHVRLGLEVTT